MATEKAAGSHRRQNLLTGEWVLVSPQRSQRPWQGQTEAAPVQASPSYQADCYLCPGNLRAGSAQNPAYTGIFVFDNDFPALSREEVAHASDASLLRSQAETGICRVICYHPDHSLSMAGMTPAQIMEIIGCWQAQYQDLSTVDGIHYIQIFENKGEMMGCSNPHPHGQIWASRSVPDIPQKEDEQQKAFWKKEGRSLLSAYLEEELKSQKRILFEDEHTVVLVPFWAVWPYETMILPKRNQARLNDMDQAEAQSLSLALSRLCRAYDRLFNCPFPYSMGIHQAPCQGDFPWWHWHFHFYPPLLRSASVKKFMVGYEMMAWPQRDISPEQAADQLKSFFA